MAHLVDCPEAESWHALFADSATADQRERFERHLETCPACQEHLDRADVCGDKMRNIIRRVGPTAAVSFESTQVPLVDRLLETMPRSAATVEVADLYFLSPSDRPGILGTLGPYEVVEVIGQGGMGVVLKAYEPALHRRVAIKVLAPAVAGSAVARQRFTREARAAAAVCHDHIVTVHGVLEIDGLPYLVMQFVAGQSLQDALESGRKLDVQEVVRIGMETAKGLAAAHAHGLIHRDIKPANLLLEEGSGRVRITDFGLARMSDDVPLTQNGVVTGTPEYMAPEQARGDTVDQRADLFSLGSVLYALCTGVPPFRAASALAVLSQVTQQVPIPVRTLNPEIPAWLEGLIARLMAKEPAQRTASAAEVATLLEAYLAHLRQPAIVPAPDLPAAPDDDCLEALAPQAIKRFPRRIWLVAVSVVAAVGLTAWLAGGAAEPSPEKKEFQEHYLSFKGMTEKPDELHYIGPDAETCVHFEPEGLRLTTRPDFPADHPSMGLAYNMVGKGDFEITTSFEILHEPESAEVGKTPARITLDVVLESDDLAALSRHVAMPRQGESQFLVFMSDHDPVTGRNNRHFKGFSTLAKAGKLRIVRTGSLLSFEAAEGPDEKFQLLEQLPFNAENVREVRVVATSGGPTAWLDVRVPDLRIRAGSLPDLASHSESHRWFLTLALMLVLGTASVFAAWFQWQKRRRDRSTIPAAPSGSATGEAAPIRFSCSGCGKSLKVRVALAGKKVRCPQCSQAVQVPACERVPG